MKYRLLFVAVLSVVALGCAYQVPLMRELPMEETPDPKYDKSILLVMSAEQAGQVIKYSPQLGDTYVFEGGPALKELTMSILGQFYREVGYAESVSSGGTYDLAVETSLRDYEISMSVRKGNTVRLNIDYRVFDGEGNVVEELSTNTSSTDKYSGGEVVMVYLIRPLFFNIKKMKEMVGTAWDTAAVYSIAEMVDTLIAFEQP
ncbi:MAG: hypothetical protein JW820_01430 [Spirochaetales bacterium]|nr:hypothetical protein [Spirochaetales bacterium]